MVLQFVGGWSGGTEVTDLAHDELRGLLDQHLWTTLNLVQAVLPAMRERGRGRIVAISSPVAAQPVAKQAAYAVAKTAEETLLSTLARELAGSGITVNVLVVRSIATGP